MTVHSHVVFAVLCLLVTCRAAAGKHHGHGHFPGERLDAFIKQTLGCSRVGGLAVSVVQGDQTVFSRGYGHHDVERGVKATEHSQFCIGSLTKAFTSTALADILSKHHNLTWDTPIRQILGPSFRMCDDVRTNHVSLRDLLAHRVGIPSNFHALLVGFPVHTTRLELVRRLQYMPAASDFRNEFHYSNYMYMLAGHVAEVLSGESWEHYVTKHLLHKLKMHSTGFVDNMVNLDNVVNTYTLQNGSLKPIDKQLLLTVSPSGPAGSITSTAADMARWMTFHLNTGLTPHGARLVDEARLTDTYRSQMVNPVGEALSRPRFPVSDTSVSYNMGWMTSNYRGYQKLWHSGGIVSFTAQLWLFPEMNSGVYVVSSGPLPYKHVVKSTAYFASDLLLGLDPWLNGTTACTYPAPWEDKGGIQPANQMPAYKWVISRRPIEYEGTYGNMAFGKIHIFRTDDNKLQLNFGRFGKMLLFPINETHFDGRYIDKLRYIMESDDGTNACPVTFIFHDDKVTTLLFPIDFVEKPTVFLRSGMFNSVTGFRTLAYSSSTSVPSGIYTSKSASMSNCNCVLFLFLLLMYFFIDV